MDATPDKLRACYGRKVVFLGRGRESHDKVPMRIALSHGPDPGVAED